MTFFNKERAVMQKSGLLIGILALGAVLAYVPSAEAALMVKFDINSNQSSSTFSPTAPGYTALDIASNTNTGSAVADGVTVTITSNINGSRNGRGGNDLLQDVLLGKGTDSTGNTTITFMGLSVGATYRFTVYSADNSVNSSTKGDRSAFYQEGNSTPFLPNVTVADSTTLTALDDARHTGILAPLTSSTLTIHGVGVENGQSSDVYTVINGFELEQVPEPAALSLLAMSGLMLVRRKRT